MSANDRRRPSPTVEEYDAMASPEARRAAFVEVKNLLATIGESYLNLYRRYEVLLEMKEYLEGKFEQAQQRLEEFLVDETEDL